MTITITTAGASGQLLTAQETSQLAAASPPRSAQVCIEPDCAARYDLSERIYTCPRCGGLLDVATEISAEEAARLRDVWRARLTEIDSPSGRSGVWRYRELLPFAANAPVVTLEEGGTPIYEAARSARYCGAERLSLKHQGCNPTGSFKDTGMTVAVTQARLLGARTVVCASTGNTAASLAAYAARADLDCAIFVPHGQISYAKLAQSLDYGATVIELEGNFDDAMRVIREVGEDESIYVVNSINPFRLEGQKTVAAELLQQLDWRVPDHVVVPGGNMGNSGALGKGFRELYELGVVDKVPRLSVVQAEGAAPLARLYGAAKLDMDTVARDALVPVARPHTLATAIKIGAPVSWRKSLRAVLGSGGRVISVSEQEIADAKAIIGRDGIGCEPASATTVAGVKQLIHAGHIAPHETIVGMLTGHVLKDADYAIKYHGGTLYAHSPGDGEADDSEHLLVSAYANRAVRVKAEKGAILEQIERRRDG